MPPLSYLASVHNTPFSEAMSIHNNINGWFQIQKTESCTHDLFNQLLQVHELLGVATQIYAHIMYTHTVPDL